MCFKESRRLFLFFMTIMFLVTIESPTITIKKISSIFDTYFNRKFTSDLLLPLSVSLFIYIYIYIYVYVYIYIYTYIYIYIYIYLCIYISVVYPGCLGAWYTSLGTQTLVPKKGFLTFYLKIFFKPQRRVFLYSIYII